MEYPVKKVFRDKFTKAKYEVGDTYYTEDTKRGNQLKKLGYLGNGKKVSDSESGANEG